MNVRTEGEQSRDPENLLQHIAIERKRAQKSLRNIDADTQKLTEWVKEKSNAIKANHEKQIAELQTDLQATTGSNSRLKDELAREKKKNAALQRSSQTETGLNKICNT